MTETYQHLTARFERHHKDPRGLEYLTGEQVVSRLNEVLGPGGWNFVVKDHGYDQEADELWALGHLEASIDASMVWREQFGSQKHNRSRKDGKILDYGFDAKGAATDALKKCATLIGVGLYLSEKDGGIVQEDAPKVAPYVPTDVREVEDADIIRSADDPLWAKYQNGRKMALALHAPFTELTLGSGLPRQRLLEGIREIAASVKKRNAELDEMAARNDQAKVAAGR